MSELRGPRGLRDDLVAFYRLWLPRHAVACRAAWGLTDEQLPVPVSDLDDARKDAYFPGDPPAIDRWPMLTVSTGRRTQQAVDQTEDGELEYRSVYPVRVFTWVKAEGRDVTQAMRDDLATVVQIATLSHINLGGDGSMAVVPTSVVTDFSRIEPVKGERFVAGSFVGFDLQVVETLTDRLAMPGAPPGATVDLVIADGTPYPPEQDVTP